MTDCIAWALDEIEKRNWKVTASAESVQITPWSSVYRFKKTNGFIYLKSVPEKLAMEPDVIQMLSEKFNASVPTVLAVNRELHCFLMTDCGIRLHDYFKKEFQSEILIHLLQHYNEIQIKSINHIAEFLELGVPDWGLSTLPKLYESLISEEQLLLDDGLTQEEINDLKKLQSKLSDICEKLLQYNIPDTFGHADFHDKNILINPETNKTTIIDLGEVVITHPFFSLHNCLHMAKENFNLNDAQYTLIKNAVLKKWLPLESEKNIAAIFSLHEKFWSIHAVLGEYRLMQSVDLTSFQKLKREGRISQKLRCWISENKE